MSCMNGIRRAPALLALGMLLAPAAIRAADGPVYELRIYTCEPGKLDALHQRFREHTLRIFEKHGMKNVAYWTPVEEPTAGTTLVYLLEHKSRDAATASWDGFRNDPEWKEVARQSQEDHGKILAKPPESTYLAATDYSPVLKPLDPGKIYELRVYTAAGGKLDALNARFRDHTVGILARHGMRSVAYWTPLDEPKSQNTLVYVLAHDSRDAARTSWRAFGADPEWQSARKESEQDGPLLAGRPEATYMQLTPYSPRSETSSR